MKRYPRYTLVDTSKVFHYFKRPDNDGEWIDCFYLKLPFFGMGYSICEDVERWGQRILWWHGRRGFRLAWYFKPEALA